MLTQKDFDEIGKRVREIVKEQIKHLPNKEEFYTRMDEVMGEIKEIREEQTLIAGRVSQHSDDLEEHEAKIKRIVKQIGLSI